MIETDSQFASENPNYFQVAARPAGQAPVQATPKQDVKISKTPVENTIYDNVDIDSAKETEDGEALDCSIDEANSGDWLDSVASFFGGGPTDIVSADVDSAGKGEQQSASFLSGISKKQWLIGGGLAAGILMLKGGKKQ